MLFGRLNQCIEVQADKRFVSVRFPNSISFHPLDHKKVTGKTS